MIDTPVSIDAEQALLGALLYRNSEIEEVPDLKAEHFSDPVHSRIFEEIAKAVAANRRADPITLAPHITDVGEIGTLSIAQYLGRLLAAAPTAYAKNYAHTVIDMARRRALILLAEDIQRDAQLSSDIPVTEQIERAETALYSMAERGTESRLYDGASSVAAAVEHARAAFRRGAGLAGLSTGLRDLDSRLGGLAPSALIVLAGRPAMGKSACAINIAYHNAAAGIPVGIFSLEMAASELAMRVLAERTGTPAHRWRSGRTIGTNELGLLADHAAVVSSWPVWIDESGGLSIAQLTLRARRMKRKHAIKLLVIDYLQLMQGTNRRNRVEDVSEITVGLKALAKELEIPVLALSQLSRGPEGRENKRPQLADLRESGSIEQDADQVLFVFREDYYASRDEPKDGDYAAITDWKARMAKVQGIAELIIAKNRHGPTDTVKVAFNGALTRFSDLAAERDNS